jgi:hypothetical protein
MSMWDQKNPSAIVQVLPYGSPNSPELSPIENLWAWAQAKVGHKPRHKLAARASREQFKACVLKTLNEVPPSYLINLFKSMKERVKSCLETNGGKTKY